MASMVRSTDDFSAEDARIRFKLATRIDKRCSNLDPRINENRPNVPKVRFLLATLTIVKCPTKNG